MAATKITQDTSTPGDYYREQYERSRALRESLRELRPVYPEGHKLIRTLEAYLELAEYVGD